MHRRALILSAASAALAACNNEPAPGEARRSARPVRLPAAASPSTGTFDIDLYRSFGAGAGNLFVSPFSVACAFGLVYPGARGETGAEIARTFGFDASPAAQAARTRALTQTLTAQTGASQFTTANAAWVERTMRLRADYARMVRNDLGASIEAVDFISDQAAALRRINAWVARETHERIPAILTDEDPQRRLVLTNAVYFKGKWSDPFSVEATRDGDFHAASGATQRARLMHNTTYARYFEGEGFQAADFDYDDGEFALAVFLPRERAGLDAFERRLTGANLDARLDRLTSAERTELVVTLPKVELDANYDLVPQLGALGVRAAFSDRADFSGVTEMKPLLVSAVIHKTFLAIDEEGTEAAAVTAPAYAAADASEPPPPPIEFKADHPFFIVLRHKATKARLFLGRIAAVAGG